RRRHTRSLRDWSSDVCSSDLDLRDLALLHGNLGSAALLSDEYARARRLYQSALALSEELGDRGRLPSHHQAMGVAALLDGSLDRSEERRVGKECRSGWWASDA